MREILKVEKLKRFFRLDRKRTLHALDGVSFSINEKEILGLVGESGCGKSTLGKTLCGLHEKTDGEVFFKGEKLPQKYLAKDFLKYSRKMQIIFQDPYSSLNPRMTVKEIISEGPKIHGIWKGNSIKKVSKCLEQVSLDPDHMSRYPHEFSGGQRQRIGIARALAMEPEFIVCDEPISALDVSVQAQVIELLAGLKDSLNLTLLFIAHDLSMVRYVSDRMAVMYLGQIVELGEADEVFFEPRHPYTELLTGSNPEADPKVEKERKYVGIKGELRAPINMGSTCRFYDRCPKRFEKCKNLTPELKETSKDHLVACHKVPPDF